VSAGGACCNLNPNGTAVWGKVPYPVGPETECEADLNVPCFNARYGITTLCGENSECCDGVCQAPGGACCENTDQNPFVCGAGGACCGNACMDGSSKCCVGKDGYRFPVSLLTTCEEAAPPTLRSASPTHKKHRHHWSLIEETHEQESTQSCTHGWQACGGFCIPAESWCCTGLSNVKYQCAPLANGENACCGGGCVSAGGACCNLNPNGTAVWGKVPYPVGPETECEADLNVPCFNARYGITTLCGENSECCDGVCQAAGGACCNNTDHNPFVCGAGGNCCGNACMDGASKCCVGKDGYKFPVSLLTTCEDAAPPITRSAPPARKHRHHWSLIEEEPQQEEKPVVGETEAELGVEYPRAPHATLTSVDDIITRGWAKGCPITGSQLFCPSGSKCCHGTCISKFSICCQNTLGHAVQCASDGSSCCGNACAGAGSKCCTHPGHPNLDYPVTEATICSRDAAPPVSCPANSTSGVPFACGAGSTCCGTICAGEGSGCFRNSGGNFYVCGAGSTSCGDACAAPGNHCCELGGKQWPVVNAEDCPHGSRWLFTV